MATPPPAHRRPRSPRGPEAAEVDHCSTAEAAARLGMAVRSVQLMVDRGELDAWRTPGGHRRITRASVEAWLQRPSPAPAPRTASATARTRPGGRPCVLLIEDSAHFQQLIRLLVERRFPQVDLQVADNGIAGLARAGQLQPQVLLVDILLPGIDGATLITGLRSHEAFGATQLIVVTSLEGKALAPYALALDGVPVVHKSRLVAELPPLLESALHAAAPA